MEIERRGKAGKVDLLKIAGFFMAQKLKSLSFTSSSSRLFGLLNDDYRTQNKAPAVIELAPAGKWSCGERMKRVVYSDFRFRREVEVIVRILGI